MAKNKHNISVVGQSNIGKSTLINYLNGKYITTESKKTQTTRINLNNMIQNIYGKKIKKRTRLR